MLKRRPPALRIILSLVVLMALLVTGLSFGLFRLAAHAANPIPPLNNISAEFFANPNNIGVFDASPATPVVFSQTFPVINFNPDPSAQSCSPSSGVNQDTRPFTDVVQNPDGTCTTIPARDSSGNQAGTRNLYSFEAAYFADLQIPSAGTATFSEVADDGWILSIGSDSNGDAPTPRAGNPLNNPPSGYAGAIRGYREMADHNSASAPQLSTIAVTFPSAGTYPLELDYSECCGGQLVNTLSVTSFTPGFAAPTGKWVSPTKNTFAVRQGQILHFETAVDPSPGGAGISKVQFEGLWDSTIGWYDLPGCALTSPRRGTDRYHCNWDLTYNGHSIPPGALKVRFTVTTSDGNAYIPASDLQGKVWLAT